jgi:hypothetical protein
MQAAEFDTSPDKVLRIVPLKKDVSDADARQEDLITTLRQRSFACSFGHRRNEFRRTTILLQCLTLNRKRVAPVLSGRR